ncbi:MAG TPA: TetR/AcrR family transcriptional regulator [Solirubrobacterales bacterium]|nr:TetR/AcrR family transcriptional regulator [Solirubrobacterales bacterium]
MATIETATKPDCAPLRADAQRNRERILAAASKLIAIHGNEVEMTDIAEAAGVGVGTLYRRFPDREALLIEMLREKFAELVATLRGVLEREDLTARERLDTFIRASCEIQGRDLGLHEALSTVTGEHQAIARSTPGLVESMERLAAEAVAEGSVRSDLAWEDIVMCSCALGHVIQHEDSLPGSWERLLAIQLAGLNPGPPG